MDSHKDVKFDAFNMFVFINIFIWDPHNTCFEKHELLKFELQSFGKEDHTFHCSSSLSEYLIVALQHVKCVL